MGKKRNNKQKFPPYVRRDDERSPEEKVSSEERVELFKNIVNYEFNNPALLEQALTHHTMFHDKSKADYERLEYIGDAVLGLLVARYHYFEYPNLMPGDLTALRAANADTEKLARVAFKHELFKFIRHNHQDLEKQINAFRIALADHPIHSWGVIKVPKVLADIVESLVGAIYLDSNSSVQDSNFSMDTTWTIVKNLLEPIIRLESLKTRPVAMLDCICQKMGFAWEAREDLWDDTHDVEILVNGELAGIGNHIKSKNIATSIAAENAYTRIISTMSNLVETKLSLATQIAHNIATTKQKYRGNKRSDDKRFPEEKVSSHERVKLVNNIIDHEFNNPSLLEEALTHHSFCEEKKLASYERLEYVGDAVVGLLVAKHHYFMHPDLSPGELSKLRAANVDTEKLARVALKHGLYKFLRHNHPTLEGQIRDFRTALADHPLHSMGLIEAPKVLSDIVESLVGAIYLDSNSDMDKTWLVVKNLFEPIITPENLKSNPVTMLSELCAKNGLKWEFIKGLWKETHDREEVLVNGEFAGRGSHSNKRNIARNRAAKNAYHHLLSQGYSVDSSTSSRIEQRRESGIVP